MKKSDFFPQDITYFNTAGDGLLSSQNYEKLDEIRACFRQNFTESRMQFLIEDEVKLRDKASHFMNCNASEICLTKSFSVGFNYLLPSLNHLNKVLLLDDDYPSIWLPLGLRDLEINYVSKNDENTFSSDRIIAEAEIHHPEIIALSHVQYNTGYLVDIKKIGDYCAQNNILFIVDGTQALGCVPVNLSELNVDVYAASTYKWLCAGHGCGIMYVSQSCQQKLKYKTGGYMAWFESGNDWKIKQSLTNLEAGHKDHEAFYRLGLALDDALAKDMNQVLQDNRNLVLQLNSIFKENGMEIISDYLPEEFAGITVIRGDEALFSKLKENKIYATYRNETIRFSCHFYNDAKDLSVLTRFLAEWKL